VSDFIALWFALVDRASEQPERFEEEAGDEVRLQAAGLGAFQILADCAHPGGVHRIVSERALFQQFLTKLAVGDIVHGLKETGAHVGPVAVTDGLHQKVPQTLVAEEFAKYVEDAALNAFRCSSIFSKSRLKTSPSRVSSATRFHRGQTSVWPMR
jgi:hypothetical protein